MPNTKHRLTVFGQSLAEKWQLGQDTPITSDKVENAPADDQNYGGKGKFELPADHQAGMKVPHGGSSCANCKFLRMEQDGPHCEASYFVQWNGGNDKIPTDNPEEYCSDWFMPRE
jgi:hypothetical protein